MLNATQTTYPPILITINWPTATQARETQETHCWPRDKRQQPWPWKRMAKKMKSSSSECETAFSITYSIDRGSIAINTFSPLNRPQGDAVLLSISSGERYLSINRNMLIIWNYFYLFFSLFFIIICFTLKRHHHRHITTSSSLPRICCL